MSNVKPVSGIIQANRAAKASFPDRIFCDSASTPLSPKIRELQIRHKALHAAGKDRSR